MNELVIRPVEELDERIQLELEAMVGRKMIGPARTIGYDDLKPVGFSPPLTERRWQQDPGGGWWLLTPRELDPTADQNGGRLPAPPEVVDLVNDLGNAGFDCEHIALGHQMPAEWTPKEPMPALVPSVRAPALPDEALVELTQAPLSLATQAIRGVALAAAGTLAVGALAVALPAAALVATAGAVIELDPILLGGVQHPEVPVVGWVEIARWSW